jgi:hypothetical protein
LTLYFDPLTTITLFVSVLIVNLCVGDILVAYWLIFPRSAIQDGSTNWFEGMGLILVYVVSCLLLDFVASLSRLPQIIA